MKKFFSWLLILGLVIVLAACNKDEKDTFKPIFYGLFNTTIEEGDDFDPLAGVKAEDDVDGDITDKIEVVGTVDTNKVGTYLIEYVVKDNAGNEKRQYRQITVDYKFAYGRTYNGDFSDGLNKWSSWFGEGGSGSVEVVDEVLVYKVDKIGNQFWATQFNQSGIGLESGKIYKLTFKAKADIARKMKIKVENPDYAEKDFDLTTEWATYELEFSTAGKDTTENAKINFFLGPIEGDDPATTVYLDDITLTEVTE